ncbi:MAG: MBL fold metallo-hydrolase [Deltaproteobacteria bacterium]|nr:MBL fold metallo-hydrolase [Deltaproteobacteria bacterium]
MEKIFENFYMITLPMPFRLKHVHVFALVHDGGVALFDTGVNSPETFLKLESSLKQIGRTIHDIDQVYVSHFHTDHCGIAGRIKELSGAVIYMSPVDAARILSDQQGDLNVKLLRTFYRLHGLTERSIESLVRLLKFFQKATIPFEADQYLEAHEYQTLGDKKFEILPAPGHTRGQVCFFFRNEGILLSCDHVLPQITPNLSPDPYHPGFRPLQSFIESLQEMENLPVSRVYPAHGDPFADLKGRVEEIIAHHRERRGLILDSVTAAPKTAYRVSQDIFGEALPEFDQFLAVNETYSHLLELQEEGLVREEQTEHHLLYRAGSL